MEIRISYHLAQIMDQKSISERQLANLSGVGKTTINDIVNNRTHPTIDTICMLAIALDIRSEQLYSYEKL
ncbi:helix-turn-helix transcriptional regulator [Cuneatibacter caecimuris]|uniref:helix-turn-helix transcriptional regulator n=1 Tax=Cuneatibacter caecimuris TaxID=1796618 RepID=UPI00102C1AE4|nr:helix-turn-helix transcriptional regulator [Cuneatibacter caecimuris]